MTPEEILHAALVGDAAVSALVGRQVFADVIGQGAERPVIVYQRAGTEPQTTIHGVQYGAFVDILVVIHSAERDEADAIAAAVTAALSSAKFWQTKQSGGFEPEINAKSVAVQYTCFDAR